MKRILYILFASLILVGCRDMGAGKASDLFAKNATSSGVWLNGRQALVKSDRTHQESRRGKAYRIQTDDQSIYVNILLNTVPTVAGQSCTASISSRGVSGLVDMVVDMVVHKVEAEMLWLWNEDKKLGVVIPAVSSKSLEAV